MDPEGASPPASHHSGLETAASVATKLYLEANQFETYGSDCNAAEKHSSALCNCITGTASSIIEEVPPEDCINRPTQSRPSPLQRPTAAVLAPGFLAVAGAKLNISLIARKANRDTLKKLVFFVRQSHLSGCDWLDWGKVASKRGGDVR